MSQAMNEHEWLQRIAELPREMAPQRDPWPEIAQRIEGARANGYRRRPRRWAVLAAAAVVVLAVTMVFRFAVDPVPVPIDGEGSQTAGTSLAAGAFAGTEAEYRAAFAQLSLAGPEGGGLPPAMGKEVERDWTGLSDAERQLAAALERQPDSLLLNEMMRWLHARQLRLLQRIAALEPDNDRRVLL